MDGSLSLSLYFACGPQASDFKIQLDGTAIGIVRVQKRGSFDPCWRQEEFSVMPGQHVLSVASSTTSASAAAQIDLKEPRNWVIIGQNPKMPQALIIDIKDREPKFL